MECKKTNILYMLQQKNSRYILSIVFNVQSLPFPDFKGIEIHKIVKVMVWVDVIEYIYRILYIR